MKTYTMEEIVSFIDVMNAYEEHPDFLYTMEDAELEPNEYRKYDDLDLDMTLITPEQYQEAINYCITHLWHSLKNDSLEDNMEMTNTSAALLLRNIEDYKALSERADRSADEMNDENTPAEEAAILYELWNMSAALAKAALEKVVRTVVLFSHRKISAEKAKEMITDPVQLDNIIALCKRFNVN